MAPERRRAFTLVEVMIGATIGSFVLAGVLSTFLLLGRSGANIVAYTVMDTQTRRAIEEFAQDVRMASAIVWNDSASVTLTVPDN
jgi:prepilin-type N-terminal cleavage/methylation domain-containing protein